MSATITVTNPLPPAAWTPTPGPERVDLTHIPITRTRPPIPGPKWAGGDIAKQHRTKGNRA